MALDFNQRSYTKSVDQAAIDEGLRAYMLKVYNYMTIGLLLTGFIAYFFGKASIVTNDMGQIVGVTQLGALLFGSPLKWIVMLAPLGFVFYLSARINRMSVSGAQITFWLFASIMGLSLASVFIAIIGIIQSLTFSSYSSIILSLAGFITGFMSLYLINKIYYLFKLRNGIGEGDFLLFGAILAIHGVEMFGPILLIASCITLGIGYLTRSLQGEMPLGTGLAIAGIVFLLIPL